MTSEQNSTNIPTDDAKANGDGSFHDPKHRHGRDLTTGSIPRNLIMFALPMLAGNVLQTTYSLVNAFWVGRYLGTASLAAISVSFPVIFVLMALAGGLTMASNIMISQYAGAREWVQVKRVVQTSTALVLAISLVLLFVGEWGAGPLLAMMHTPPEVMPLAVGYMHILLISLPFQFAMFLVGSTMRGVGDSTTPLYFQTVFLVITAVLDPLLMFGWAGFPRLGLNGTAVATTVTMSLASVSLFIYLHIKRHVVSPDWRRLSVDKAMAWLTMKIGLPSAFKQALVSISAVVIISLVNHFGEHAVAAFGAGIRIDQVAFMPAMMLGMAVSTVAGQNIGAKRYDRVSEAFRWTLLFSGGITLVIATITYLAPHALLSMFINGARDPEVLAIGVGYLRIMAISYVIYAVMFTSNGVINGAGHTMISTCFTLVALWVVRVPLATTLSGLWQLPGPFHSLNLIFANDPVVGIWYAMVLGVGAGMVVSLGYYFSGRWKKAVIRHGPLAGAMPPSARGAAPAEEAPSLESLAQPD